jgi:hypothetical protein
MVWTVIAALGAGMFVGVFGGKLFPDPPNSKRKYVYLGIGIVFMVIAAFFGANNL